MDTYILPVMTLCEASQENQYQGTGNEIAENRFKVNQSFLFLRSTGKADIITFVLKPLYLLPTTFMLRGYEIIYCA